ncbi:flagellar biosynthetic protein FlhB [Thioflavicoccus mobilis 8321]|uniref:Flagellar biosynthetic protein FlhB n=1 Tax=Thioflavicoccus mobilis 8321 TaxID=765912 RepID=U3GM65_9GAMM|nr:flagellar biosynthesis protein FlhB [Thioflavicoccus mobilis]AGA89153.1 flagellar biosynthetic protein FlhB [Thioflavicoccus mobilis 8321]
MEGGQTQERTEKATPKRLRDAKRKGQVPRSRELNTALMLVGGALMLYGLGPTFGRGLMGFMEHALDLGPVDVTDPTAMVRRFHLATQAMLTLFAPFLVGTVVIALAAPALLGGWAMSAEALRPKLERLDPIKGFGRIFSIRGLVELIKAIVKLVLVAGVSGAFLWSLRGDILAPPVASLNQELLHAFHLFGVVVIALAASTFLVAIIDVPYQLWDHRKKLRMTRQEVRDESKETEGRPEVKGRIRQLQREFSKRRMMQEVPRADLVVANPSHFSVALRYEPLRARAPRVVAKGADLMAMQIRTIARDNGVPVIEAPPLARALYHNVELDQEIPAALYLAVAQLLAYVHQLRTARASGAREPVVPEDLAVPEELTGGRP